MTTPKELAGNLVTLDKRDLFDAVRAAIKEAAHVDADILEVIGRKSDEAAEWSDAHDRAARCLAPLIEPVEDGDYYSEEADDIEQSRASAGDEVTDAQRLAYLLNHCIGADDSGWMRILFETSRQHKDHPPPIDIEWMKADIDGAIDAAMQKDTQ
jgi:hypothetical protein